VSQPAPEGPELADLEPDPSEFETADQAAAPATNPGVDPGVDPGEPSSEPPPEPPSEPTAPEVDVTAELVRQLDERTADLQRLQAEYVNYKRRVDRDRQVVRDTAVATVLTGLLGVLDDLDRARQHGELTGGFKAVADSLERTLTGLGLERFGTAGEPFDPRVHEALLHEHSEQVDGPTAQEILQPGYRVAERVLRPARVAVAEPPPVDSVTPVVELDTDPDTHTATEPRPDTD